MEPLLWCKTHKLNKRGLAPISLRITVHGVRAEHSTSIRVRPEDWQQQKQKVKTSAPGATAFNDSLTQLPGLATSAKNRLEALGEKVTAASIVALLKNPAALQAGPPPDLLAFMYAELESHYLPGNRGTYESVRSVVRKLHAWHGDCPLPVTALPPTRAHAFYRHLLQNKARGGEIANANKVITWLTALYRRGVKQRIWAAADNPFLAIEKKSAPKRQKVRLTQAELVALLALPLREGEKLWRARAVYLMQFYLRGERVGAVLLMRWQHLHQEPASLQYQAQKSGPFKQVAVRPELATILQHFAPRQAAGSVFILPFLPNTYDSLTPKAQLSLIKNAIDTLNKALREAAALAGIHKPLRSHAARHTFATLSARQVGTEATQKMLGHTDPKMTRTYIAEMETDAIDQAADTVFDSLL